MKNENLVNKAENILKENRVAIYLVAYNAEAHIEKVLKRIPEWIAEKACEIFVIDDHSKDQTVLKAKNLQWPKEFAPLKIYKTPYNQGYGGNQCLGYQYAIKNKFDIVVLLHADGQYAPEALPEILAAYSDTQTQAVFGSRFLRPLDAIKGRMPIYKWLGNRILSFIQNGILGTRMSEMHSGYRSYRVNALKQIPFQFNSFGFDFDADIIVQFVAKKFKISEVPIPTYYGSEICHVNGIPYAWNCIKTAIKYKLMQLEIFYDPKFDFRSKDQSVYTVKKSKHSLHYHIRSLFFDPGTKVLDVGGGTGEAISFHHQQKGCKVTCIDKEQHCSEEGIKHLKADLNQPWKSQLGPSKFEVVFALDVIEHLLSPEEGCQEIFNSLESGGKLYASTGNVAFLPLRIMLAMGQFNYGRRGILDLTHTRLFTFDSFRRLLKNAGFKIDEIKGFGPPVSDLGGRSFVMSFIERGGAFLAKYWPRLFAFQILIVCTRTNSLEDLMDQTFMNDSNVENHQQEHKRVA